MRFPGRCERCGGPQWWTYDGRGDTFIACKAECVGEQLVLPLDSEWPGGVPKWAVMEPPEGEGVVPHEGGDARTSDVRDELPF